MPEVTLRGKAGVAKIKRDGKAIVITKQIKTAVLEERLPYRRLVGKQQQLPVTPAQFDEAIVKAVKAAKSETSLLVNKHANKTMDAKVAEHKKEIKAIIEKAAMASARAATATANAADESKKAMALKKELIEEGRQKDEDLDRIRKQRDKYKSKHKFIRKRDRAFPSKHNKVTLFPSGGARKERTEHGKSTSHATSGTSHATSGPSDTRGKDPRNTRGKAKGQIGSTITFRIGEWRERSSVKSRTQHPARS